MGSKDPVTGWRHGALAAGRRPETEVQIVEAVTGTALSPTGRVEPLGATEPDSDFVALFDNVAPAAAAGWFQDQTSLAGTPAEAKQLASSVADLAVLLRRAPGTSAQPSASEPDSPGRTAAVPTPATLNRSPGSIAAELPLARLAPAAPSVVSGTRPPYGTEALATGLTAIVSLPHTFMSPHPLQAAAHGEQTQVGNDMDGPEPIGPVPAPTSGPAPRKPARTDDPTPARTARPDDPGAGLLAAAPAATQEQAEIAIQTADAAPQRPGIAVLGIPPTAEDASTAPRGSSTRQVFHADPGDELGMGRADIPLAGAIGAGGTTHGRTGEVRAVPLPDPVPDAVPPSPDVDADAEPALSRARLEGRPPSGSGAQHLPAIASPAHPAAVLPELSLAAGWRNMPETAWNDATAVSEPETTETALRAQVAPPTPATAAPPDPAMRTTDDVPPRPLDMVPPPPPESGSTMTLRDPAEPAAQRGAEPAVTSGSAASQAGTSADPRRAIVDQLVASVRTTTGGAIEIRLSPEELGHVRLDIRMTDGVLTVRIDADRTETLDLMRRSADILARELRETGFGALDLSFGSSASHRDERPSTSTAYAGEDRGPRDAPLRTQAARGHPNDRLDIRI